MKDLIDRNKLLHNLKSLMSNVTFTNDIKEHLSWGY